MKNVSIRQLTHGERMGHGIVLIVVFAILPMASLLLGAEAGEYAGRWILYAITPAALVCLGAWLGIAHGLCLGYALPVLALSLVQGAILQLEGWWQYALGYGVIEVAGNLAAHLLYSTGHKD